MEDILSDPIKKKAEVRGMNGEKHHFYFTEVEMFLFS